MHICETCESARIWHLRKLTKPRFAKPNLLNVSKSVLIASCSALTLAKPMITTLAASPRDQAPAATHWASEAPAAPPAPAAYVTYIVDSSAQDCL